MVPAAPPRFRPRIQEVEWKDCAGKISYPDADYILIGSFLHSHGPLNCLEVHLLYSGVVPRFRQVAERRIKHSALPVALSPGDREIAVRAMQVARLAEIELAR